MKTLLIIGTGGFVGSIFRYLTQVGISKIIPVVFPYGTLAVNISGCFLIGVIAALGERENAISPEWKWFLVTGICGGFTTFSAFSFEAYGLIRNGQIVQMSVYVGLSVLLGILATYAGATLFRL